MLKKGLVLWILLGVCLGLTAGEIVNGVTRRVWKFEKEMKAYDMFLKLKEYSVSGTPPADLTEFVPGFEWSADGHGEIGGADTFYGQYFTAVLCPEKTGVYQFYFSCGGFGELRISNTEQRGKMADLSFLAKDGGVKPGDYSSQEGQVSPKIKLVAGKKYFIEALSVNRFRPNGHLAVRWITPDDPPGSKKPGKMNTKFLISERK